MAASDSPILGKYHALERLGAGAYGLVYQATDVREDSKSYAVKLERASKKKQRPPSEHEANVLRILADVNVSPRIPRVIDYGYNKPSHSKALVLDLLGADLQFMRTKCGGRFSIKTTLVLATRLIPTIRYIHSKDFVHRDIKPGNLLLGAKDNETSVYIVDFGIARRYRNPQNGAHIPFLDGKSVVGTVRYASLNTHFGIALTEFLRFRNFNILKPKTIGQQKRLNCSPRTLGRMQLNAPEILGIPDRAKYMLELRRMCSMSEGSNTVAQVMPYEYIECLAYSLLDCLRDLPWGNIRGGSPKQFEDRVREKKRSWTPERLCADIPNAFKVLLSHARQLKFDEEPDYDGLQAAFMDDMKRRGYSPDEPFDWSPAADTEDFAPPIAKKARPAQAVAESTLRLLDSIRPGDFIKLKLLGPPTVQFSGRFSSIKTDASFWQPPSLAGKEWKFPYRPAIVASVERDVVVRKGRKGMTLSVYPLMLRKEGLHEFPEHMRRRFIPLDASMLSSDPRTPEVEPKWTLANTYIYNTCATLTVSIDPCLMPKEEFRPICWHLKGSQDLTKVEKQLGLVRPSLEAGQPIEPQDRDETIHIKKNKRHLLQTVLAEIHPLVPADVQGQDVVWWGRNGWLKEYHQIGSRRAQEREATSKDSSEEYDSDYICDSISPAGERRKSCTVSLDTSYFK